MNPPTIDWDAELRDLLDRGDQQRPDRLTTVLVVAQVTAAVIAIMLLSVLVVLVAGGH